MYLHKILQREMDLEKTIISAVKRNSWVPNCEQRLLWELRKTEKPSLILKRARNVNVYDTMTTGYDLWYPTTTYCLISCCLLTSLLADIQLIQLIDHPSSSEVWLHTKHLLKKDLDPQKPAGWASVGDQSSSIISQQTGSHWFPLSSQNSNKQKQTWPSVCSLLMFKLHFYPTVHQREDFGFFHRLSGGLWPAHAVHKGRVFRGSGESQNRVLLNKTVWLMEDVHPPQLMSHWLSVAAMHFWDVAYKLA